MQYLRDGFNICFRLIMIALVIGIQGNVAASNGGLAFRWWITVEGQSDQSILALEHIEIWDTSSGIPQLQQTVVIPLTCNAHGNVTVNDPIIFDGGYLECESIDLHAVLFALTNGEINLCPNGPCDIDIQGVYAEAVVQLSYPLPLRPQQLVTFDTLHYALAQNPFQQIGMGLAINTDFTESSNLGLNGTNRLRIEQKCDFNGSNTSENVAGTGVNCRFDHLVDGGIIHTDPAAVTYSLPAYPVTFYVGGHPNNNSPFYGELFSLEFDPFKACNCIGTN